MEETPLDPRMEKLVALLYGELPVEEEQKLRESISNDRELRTLWEELAATRGFLRAWDAIPEPDPSFVFVDRGLAVPSEAVSSLSRRGRWRLKRVAALLPWAVAAAAIVVAVRVTDVVRVERTAGGLDIGLGRRPPAVATAVPSLAAETRDERVGSLEPGREPQVTLTGNQGPYLTREEFGGYATDMNQALVAILNQYASRRDRELAEALQTAFGRITVRQNQEFQDLRGQIEMLRIGFTEEQLNTRAGLNYILQQGMQEGGLVPDRPADSERRDEQK